MKESPKVAIKMNSISYRYKDAKFQKAIRKKRLLKRNKRKALRAINKRIIKEELIALECNEQNK